MSSHLTVSRRQFARLGATAVAAFSGSTLVAQAPEPALRSRHLMDLVFRTAPPRTIGPRVIAGITDGTFRGPRLKGTVVTPAGEWGATRPDGAYIIDVRLELRTDDDALIFAFYRGIV